MCQESKVTPCPCGSTNTLQNCCLPFINQTKKPDTPLELMKSRYTAYTLKNIHYIQTTMTGKALDTFDYHSALETASKTNWLKLEIISTKTQNNYGEVTFKVLYEINQALHTLTEKSAFKKINNQWLYTDALSIESTP